MAELVARAAECEYPALGLTDVSNFCGALEFAQECRAAGIQPLTGVELPVREGDAMGPVTFLAETGAGYSNLCRLASLAYLTGGRTTPELDFRFLEAQADGVIALLGAPDGLVAADLAAGRWSVAEERARAYRNRFGAAAVFLLLQQHLAHGDTTRNRRLSDLAQRCGVGTAAANAPWYHDPSRAHLHDVLTAIRRNAFLGEARRHLKVNANYGLLPPNDAARRFYRYPDALPTPWSSRNAAPTSTWLTSWTAITVSPTRPRRRATTPNPGWNGSVPSRPNAATEASTEKSRTDWMRNSP